MCRPVGKCQACPTGRPLNGTQDMKRRKLLYNARIVNERKEYDGYLEIGEDGNIAVVGSGHVSAASVASYGEDAIDLEGHLLLPGVIDSHVHFREPGGEHKGTIYTESRAAVAGGVTSYMEMPNTNPPTTSIEALEDKFARASKDSVANYSFYIGATKDNVEELKRVDYTRVPGVKLFMGSSTGGMLVEGEESLAEVFKLPVLVAAHCEDEGIIKENTGFVKNLCNGQDEAGINWHPEIRSVLACCKSTANAVALAKRYGTRLHVLHVTTAPEIAMILDGGDRVSAEVCVAHLLFSDRDYARLGTRIKCNPAVKGDVHRDMLREGLRQGVFSTVSTDHAPHALDEKMRGLFTAPSGMPMVQFSLPVMLSEALRGEWPIWFVVEKMCHAQAGLFGVENRGFIREGFAADLVEVDPEGVTEVNEGTIISKCGWSPLEGMQLRSRVKRTWVNGTLVYTDEGGVAVDAPAGEALRFRARV